jgi:hypothetical protein
VGVSVEDRAAVARRQRDVRGSGSCLAHLLRAGLVGGPNEVLVLLAQLNSRHLGAHKVLNKDVLAERRIATHELRLVHTHAVELLCKSHRVHALQSRTYEGIEGRKRGDRGTRGKRGEER